MAESLVLKKKRAQKIYQALLKRYPDAKIALRYGNNIQLLVAVILSAQCTDKKVNEVTEGLFKKYKTVDDFAGANLRVFEQEIKPTGFYRAKAKNIIAAAKMLKRDYSGKLPKTIEKMIKLPGVGRKTANIVLGKAYGIVEGIAVDTHVKKQARKLGLTSNTNPDKIEQDLMKLFPKSRWFKLTYLLIEFGREKRVNKNMSLPKILRGV